MSWEGDWNAVDTLCFQFVLTSEVFQIILRFRVKINELIVYQESIYRKESEIGKAIFSLCCKVSCVMQLAMTTKLMVLCSQSQWTWSRPNTWINRYTWCPATSLECEVHLHFITQSQQLTFIHYVAYITGWLSEALITHRAWSKLNMIDQASGKAVFLHNFPFICMYSNVMSSWSGIIFRFIQADGHHCTIYEDGHALIMDTIYVRNCV